MAVEYGIVTDILSDTAMVQTIRTAACEGCAAKGSCMSKGNDEMVVEAINTAGARIGDHVAINVRTGSVLKATFLMYLFPVLCLMAGAAIGHLGAPYAGLNVSGAAAVAGFAAFLAALPVMIRKAGKMAAADAYRPRIVRITRHQPVLPLR